MATTKPKTTAKKTAAKPKTAATKKTVKTVKTVKPVVAPVTEVKSVGKKGGIFSGFFAKKYDTNESILTIFKKPTFYGALLAEVLGTLILTLVLFSLSFMQMGVATVSSYAFAVLAIYVAFAGISGAHLNPIVTAGMMATRRISVIRGVMYIVAQILGAGLGCLIFSAFHVAGGDTSYPLPAMSATPEGSFWTFTIIELFGAIILGFFFARSLACKKGTSNFINGAVIAGSICAATLICYVISAAFFNISGNFMLNPAIALMDQIFPQTGADFGAIFGGICSALATYAIFPMVGGVLGFYLSDFMAFLSGDKNA